MTNELTRKLEVRFKRSRQKYQPTEDMKMGQGGLQNVDSLDYRDTDNNFFYEPTTELKCINNLHDGWFSVVQVPTNEHDKYRWHIFAYNSATQKVQLTSIRSSDEGLFDIKDYTVLEPKSDKDATLVPRSIPGIIQRTLDLQGVAVTNGLAATKYDIQQEQETKAGPQLMRTSSKVMLVVPTDKGTAALSFAISGDGILSQIDETPQNDVLRSTQRDVLLPLNTLEQIKAFGDTTPPEIGKITGFSVGTEADGAEDLVKITSPEAANLVSGDMVEIQNTNDYNGLYSATRIDEDTFTIELPTNEEMGTWEAVEEEGGLIFDGMVTAYQKTADGKLQVTASNHGLEDGDEVLLVGTQDYDNTYQIQKVDDANFVIQRQWPGSEAINVKLESRKRRGIVLDGAGDYVDCGENINLAEQSFTIELWAKRDSLEDQQCLIGQGYNSPNHAVFIGFRSGNQFFFNFGQNYIQTKKAYDDLNWHHWACSYNSDTKTRAIYCDGKLVQKGVSQFDTLATGNFYIGCEGTKLSRCYGGFKGSIADVRIWDTGRSEKEIQDNMYLQLTGKEIGLVGYWRLGGISEGKERQVVDFSVNGNNGIVHGDAYVGGVTLSRTLRDGMPAVKYGNDDLVAVSQRATYIEEFEFKVNEPTGTEIPPTLPVKDGLQVYLSGESLAGNTWSDLSGNQNHAIEAEKCELPSSYEVTDYNGKQFKVARFTSKGGMILPDGFSLDQPFTAIIIDRYYGSTQGRTLQSRDNNWLLGKWQGNNGCFMEGWLHNYPATVGEFTLSTATLEGTSPRYYTDGNLQKDSGGTTPPGRLGFCKGGLYDKEVSSADIACVLIYNRVLSEAERQKVEFWLGSRYGISVPEPALPPPTDINNADGNGNPIFQLSYWGKTSRSADEKIDISAQQDDFESKGNGWYRAACRFTIPDGVAMLRTFELADVRGTWGNLEIRKHYIRMVSDAITEAKYSDGLSLSSIGEKEQQNSNLIQEKQELEAKIAAVKSSAAKNSELKAKIAIQQAKVDELSAIKTSRYSEYQKEVNSPFNYFCKIKLAPGKLEADRPDQDKVYLHAAGGGHNIIRWYSGQQWEFVDQGNGFYKIKIAPGKLEADRPDPDKAYLHAAGGGHDIIRWYSGQQWEFVDQGNGFYKIKIAPGKLEADRPDHDKAYLHAAGGGHDIIRWYSGQQWALEKTSQRANDKIAIAEKAWQEADKNLKAAQAELQNLQDDVNADADNLEAWQNRLQEILQQLSPKDLLTQIGYQEILQGNFIREKTEIEAKLASLMLSGDAKKIAIQLKEKEISEQEKIIDGLQRDVNYWAEEYRRSKLYITVYDGNNYSRGSQSYGLGYVSNVGDRWNDDIDSVRVPSGLRATLYEHSWYKGFSITLTRNEPDLPFKYQNETSSIKVETINGNDNKNDIESQYQQKTTELNDARKKLRSLEDELSRLKLEGGNQLEQVEFLQERLKVVIGEIHSIQQDLNRLNAQLFEARKKVAATGPLTLSQLAADTRGLVTQGAVLRFVNPAGRLNAIETCEGNVQLTYFDDEGRMRQTLYDATSDSLNTTFEEWISDQQRTGINFNDPRSTLKLNKRVYLRENSTIEAWFFYPFAEKLYWHVLASSSDDEQQIVVYQSKYLGLRINGVFFDCGYDLEQLSPGWHHLAIATKQEQATSAFYIDGEKVGIAAAKPAVQLDSQDDFIDLPDLDLDYSVGLTIEAWVHYASLKKSRIIDFGNGSGSGDIVFGNQENTDTLFLNVGGTTVEATGVLETEQWMHLAATVNSSGNVTIYKNGLPVATGKASVPPKINRQNNFIGKSNWTSDDQWDGEIAEVRLWTLPRTQVEIQANLGKILTGNELNLEGYWRFGEGAAKDSSPKGRDGEIQGTVKPINLVAKLTGHIYSLGNITDLDSVSESDAETSSSTTAPPSSTISHTALKFDGSGDYINCGSGINLANKSFTVEFWAKQNTVTSSHQWIVCQGSNATNRLLHIGFRRGQQFTVAFYGNDLNTSISGDNQWHHWSCTYDAATNKRIIYQDGQKVAEDNTSGDYQGTGNFCIAKHNSQSVGYFPGEVAEVRIWNKARTATEIQADMAKALTGSESGLLAYWPLRDGSAQDYSPNGNNGSIQGNPQTVPFDQVQAPSTSSSTISHTALKFDGSGDYVDIQNYKGVTGTNPRTVEAWIKTTSTNQAIVSWGAHSNSAKWTFRVQRDNGTPNTIRAEVDGGYIVGSTRVNDGKWHHVACTWQNDGSPNVTDVKLYVDGQLETISAEKSCAINTATSRNVFIGGDFSNRYFNGDLAEVRIWNKVRTQAEIQGDMAKALTGSEPGLVGYWPLRDGSAQDYSANGNNGTIYGNPQTVPFDQVQAPTTASDTATPIKETNPNAHHFGKLAEVRIWGVGLNDEEIAVNSKTLISGNEPGLLAYYPMTEATATEVRDYSGNDRHGTMQGASWWGCAAPIGNVGHTVMQFDGKNDYISTENSLLSNLSAFTLEGWVKASSVLDGVISLFGQNDVVEFGIRSQKLSVWTPGGGSITGDSSYPLHEWHHVAVVGNGKNTILYLDGTAIKTGGSATSNYGSSSSPFQIAAGVWSGGEKNPFSGQLAEVRIWKVARTPAEIRATMQQRLTGQEAGLVGYWPLSKITAEGTPDLTGNHPGTVREAILAKDNTLPIGANALVSSEYSTITVDPATGRKSAMMRRFFASTGVNGAYLLAEKRIEQLQLQWVGNAQFAPTLLGYIEGAPPIPTENLTVQPDYNGATSVELNMSEDVEFSWSRSQDAGLGASLEGFIGAEQEVRVAAGLVFGEVETTAAELRVGAKGTLDLSYQFLNESNITSSSSNSMTDRLELRGSPEQSVKFPI
jgi:hypothetical protein